MEERLPEGMGAVAWMVLANGIFWAAIMLWIARVL